MTHCDFKEERSASLSFLFFFSLTVLFSQNSQPPPCSPYPEGDFRAAQVAQDEVRRRTDMSVPMYLMFNTHTWDDALKCFLVLFFFFALGNCTFYAEAGDEVKA